MEGMSLDNLKEVLNFMQEHHAFASYKTDKERAERKKQYPKMAEYGFGIKYVDMCYDSRTQDIWAITFREGRTKVRFATNQITAITIAVDSEEELKKKGIEYKSLKDICMAFFKGEFEPPEEFYIRDDG
jgi:hypothetical protein